MALTLSKGENISLTKTDPGMTRALVGLGWDERATDGADFDLDASVFLLGADGKVRSSADFIFYNQLKSADGAVEHTGDNRTGEGDDTLLNSGNTAGDLYGENFDTGVADGHDSIYNAGDIGGDFVVNRAAQEVALFFDFFDRAQFFRVGRHRDTNPVWFYFGS